MKTSFVKFCVLALSLGVLHSFSFADGLDYINVNFCGTTDKTITYTTTPGTPVNICYNVSNSATIDQAVKIGFVDGTLTNDQWKLRACKLDTMIQSFGQYVTNYEPIITVNSGSTVEKSATLNLPLSSTGLVRGCLVYTLAPIGGVSGVGTNFTVQIRKAKFIDVNVVTP